MEHLDLAGYITTPTTHWTLPAFEQQDAIYLSSSRQMLEPILEETSEDEDFSQNSWSQYDHTSHVWSSAESETGSVIRIEITKDPDSISERDFACPAKRPRRSDEFLNTLSQQPSSLDDTVLLRRNLQRSNEAFGGLESLERNSLERFLAFEAASRDSLGASSQQRSSTGSRRFDDFYSDSDSLSYHSLSRSSSLIQFESLERQMLQDQHSSLGSLGNSSPSLLSFDGGIEETTHESSGEIAGNSSGGGSGGNSGCNSGSNSRRGSQNSLLRRFESTDGRLHQTYYELDKLNFDDDKETEHFGSGHFGGASKCSSSMELIVRSSAAEVKSDSESSTSSASSGNSILTASKPSAEDLIDSVKKSSAAARTAAFQRGGSGGKNSAENLSEDSGYCEPSQSLRRSKSKSIPKNFEKFCEEDEFFNDDEHDDDDGVEEEDEVEDEDDDSQNTHSKNSTVIEHDICQPKIAALDATFLVESATTTTATPSAKATATPETKPLWLYYDSIKNSAATRDTQQEQQQQQKQPQQWEQQKLKREQRLLAHSPSPVSDTGSTTSSSSCASANSFTWLPTHAHIQQKQHQPQQRQLMFKQLLPQTLDFPEHLRNSLPDIRDANGSFSLDDDPDNDEQFFNSQFSSNCSSAKQYSYVVDSQKSIDPASACRLLPPPPSLNQNSRMRTCSLTDDSDTSAGETSSSSSTTETSSTSTSNTETDQSCLEQAVVAKARKTKKTIAANIVGVESGRGSSVPNELDKIGRKKRNSKLKHSRIKTHNWTSESELSEAEENDDEFNGAGRIRRTCSWTERRERNLQNFEGAFGIPKKHSVQTQSLGYMNASYINLTLLDYSGHEDIAAASKNRSNFKRAGWNSMESSSRKSAGDADYEGIICKGNFLLDELSEIYDKNASILNDKILESDEDDFKQPPFITKLETKLVIAPLNVSPKAPARQRARTNLNYSDVNTIADKPEVQHVQLTIRNPPARQVASAVNKQEKVSITPLSAEIQTNFSSFGKTFDQDPTNLRTSYAQSLEKCNFDANELSNTDILQSAAHAIPKRRFQSHAATNKKSKMVSSTPNLNAFDPGANELEDDMYVTSAHASMHQLPQGATGQKPLGILLPAGSRTSFSKEVSFCPVVSKYMWQEQSSEECNEPSPPDHQDSKEEESTDDELLDNADATVIYNTKENEMIATYYNSTQLSEEQKECSELERETSLDVRANEQQRAEEQKQRDPQRAMAQEREVAVLEKVRATIVSIAPSTTENIAKTSTSQTTDDGAERVAQSVTAEKLVSNVDTEPSAVSQTTTTFAPTTLTQRNSANESHTSNIDSNRNSTDNVNITTTTHPTRPLSLHLPILSEPPTNRAHVLYASQQLINQLQDQQQSQFGGVGGESARAVSAINLSTSSNVRPAFVTKMSKHGIVNYTDSPDGSVAKPYNNNNEMKGKFKPDEKHPSSKGFLSRFAHGFRFSLRRNKKKQLQQQQQQQQEQPATDQVATLEKYAKAEKSKVAQNGAKLGKAAAKSPDFVFIPLKAPLPANNGGTATVATSVNANRAGNGKHVSAAQPATTPMIVTGKPPLPKQPPRVEKLPQQQQSAGTPAHNNHNKTPANFATAQFYIATPVETATAAKATTIDECFLDSERSYYDDFKNQLNTGMQANGRMYAAAPATGSVSMDPNPSPPVDASSPSRASVSQKTQMFNNLSSGGTGAGASVNGKIVTLNNIGSSSNHHGKIGLIETNLDTHETVISGKTRSLMELGPQQLQQQQSRFKFIQRGGAHGAHGGYQADGDDDDDDVDAVVDGIDGAGVVVKGLPQQAGQIASVRRPHKSMEFLLDKENQKNVLVCTT